MVIYLDDFLFLVLGLFCIVLIEKDMKVIFEVVLLNVNGFCYCMGLLGVDLKNNLEKVIDDFGDWIYFLYLWNIFCESENIFRELVYLEGDINMDIVVEKLFLLMNKRNVSLLMCLDYGFLYVVDEKKEMYSGYFLVGRLKGLVEFRGLERGIVYKLKSF